MRQRGRVRAQAPGETQQKMETARGKRKGRTGKNGERKQERRTEQNTNGHMKTTSHEEKESDFATQKATALSLGPPTHQLS